MSESILPPARDIIITGGVVSTSQLVRAYDLHNVRVLDTTNNNNYDGKISQATQKDKALYMSSLGTPVAADLTFVGDRYTDFDRGLVIFDSFKLTTVLINVSQSKNIRTTDLQGTDSGTVKEYISMGDYQISIDCIINGPNGHYPMDEVRALLRVLDAPIAIRVVSRYLQNLDINEIVILNYSLGQEAGRYSEQKISIRAVSDEPMKILDLQDTVQGGPLVLDFNVPTKF